MDVGEGSYAAQARAKHLPNTHARVRLAPPLMGISSENEEQERRGMRLAVGLGSSVFQRKGRRSA